MQKWLKLFALTGFSVLAGGATMSSQSIKGISALGHMTTISDTSGGREMRFDAYLTGYSYWDNTPPGSAAIARPVIHRQAGGTGSYHDPITIAVGHSILGGRQTLDFREGTRFYIGSLQKYAIVEDVCGDGPTPQNGPCHSGRNGLPWLDIYVGGRQAGPAISDECMRRITAVHSFIINPRAGYPVLAGELANNCQILSS